MSKSKIAYTQYLGTGFLTAGRLEMLMIGHFIGSKRNKITLVIKARVRNSIKIQMYYAFYGQPFCDKPLTK